jgi:single-strand DNA-binding protein
MYLNKVYIIGNLTRDPEMKSLPSGIKVTTFGIATNRVWKDKDGSKKEATEFHNIVVFGRQAETCAQYLKKGQNVLAEGRIQTRSWDGTDGVKRYRTEIIADRIQFGAKTTGTGGSGGDYNKSESTPSASPKEENMDTIEYPEEDISPDDIPF